MKKGIKEEDIREFEKYCQKLKSVMDKINEYNQEANIYVSDNSMYLMCENYEENSGI